jgi:hypothetical protein
VLVYAVLDAESERAIELFGRREDADGSSMRFEPTSPS